MPEPPENQRSGGPGSRQPWIPMRTGIIIIAITSIVMFVLTAMQSVPAQGWVDGLLTALLWAGLIWIIFLGMLWINRRLR